MHDPKPLNLIHPVKYRNISEKRPYRPEDMDKSLKNSEGNLDENYGKTSMPSHNRAKMPQMKP